MNLKSHFCLYLETDGVLMIQNTKTNYDRINNRLKVSCPINASNEIYEYDMIELSYHVLT